MPLPAGSAGAAGGSLPDLYFILHYCDRCAFLWVTSRLWLSVSRPPTLLACWNAPSDSSSSDKLSLALVYLKHVYWFHLLQLPLTVPKVIISRFLTFHICLPAPSSFTPRCSHWCFHLRHCDPSPGHDQDPHAGCIHPLRLVSPLSSPHDANPLTTSHSIGAIRTSCTASQHTLCDAVVEACWE